MKKKEIIETIAETLLKNRIAFDYEPNFLTVKDYTVKHELFETASYHAKTRQLILMCSDYEAIEFVDFENYFAKFK